MGVITFVDVITFVGVTGGCASANLQIRDQWNCLEGQNIGSKELRSYSASVLRTANYFLESSEQTFFFFFFFFFFNVFYWFSKNKS